MNVYLELNNFKGISLPVSAISEWQLTLSILNLLRFVAVALKKHTHHRTTISSFLFIGLYQDLLSLTGPTAHKSFCKKRLSLTFAGVCTPSPSEQDFSNCCRSQKRVKVQGILFMDLLKTDTSHSVGLKKQNDL